MTMNPEKLIEASKDLLTDLQDELSKYAKQAPECISQLLALIDSLQADLTQSELVIRAKMTCIDEQAKELALLKEVRQEQTAHIKALNEQHEQDLFVLARTYKEQIKKLQAALTKERFWKIWREGKHDDVAKVTELAKKQLRAEMPEEMA